jgi:ubiquinone/menaquinone biosynthesis C-methylase UbiE
MKNRYIKILRKYNQDILELLPYNPLLFNLTAKEIKGIYKKGARILEIGAGEGDSALPILKHTDASLDLLDVSDEMLATAKKILSSYKNRVRFICEDGYDYLKKSESYDIIFSSMTVHNFNQEDKKRMFEIIYKNLKKGGSFILMDKIYPMKGRKELLKIQIDRYKRYLPKIAAEAITKHEIEDMSDNYRMDEKPLLKLLNQIGFKTEITQRVERDCILIAKK